MQHTNSRHTFRHYHSEQSVKIIPFSRTPLYKGLSPYHSTALMSEKAKISLVVIGHVDAGKGASLPQEVANGLRVFLITVFPCFC
jgi:hypothetical protein